jgi:hypothetical protein
MKLYKYREFNKNNINCLKRNSIWCSDRNKLNDKFDALINYDIKHSINNVCKICSFSTQKNDTLWALYAKSFQGYAIEYEFNDKDWQFVQYKINENITAEMFIPNNKIDIDSQSIELDIPCFIKCIYVDIKLKNLLEIKQHFIEKHKNDIEPIIDGKKYQNIAIIAPFLAFKSRGWIFEEECRFIIPNKFQNEWDIRNLFKINKIHVGYDMKTRNQSIIKNICNSKNIDFVPVLLDDF